MSQAAGQMPLSTLQNVIMSSMNFTFKNIMDKSHPLSTILINFNASLARILFLRIWKLKMSHNQKESRKIKLNLKEKTNVSMVL